jgi:phage terminase large subunit GpA-like protein
MDYGCHISSLYALYHGSGDIAARGISRRKKTTERRQWINEDLGETWTEREEEDDTDKIAARLVCPTTRHLVVPLGFSVLTAGVDRQNDGTYPYVVNGWDSSRRAATIEYAYAQDDKELIEGLCQEFLHADKRGSLGLGCVLIDSGFRPKDIAKVVRALRKLGIDAIMCKGANQPLQTFFKVTTLAKDSATPGMRLINVDTYETQNWIDDALNDLNYLDEESIQLWSSDERQPAANHDHFLEQLRNDEAIELMNKQGNIKVSWNRRDTTIPNDWRDCMRYSRAALEVMARLGSIPTRDMAVMAEERRNMAANDAKPRFTTPHGQSYLATER